VDQRVIDDLVGHQTDEQRRRYRHLYPDIVRDAVSRVFGKEILPKPGASWAG
jgi:hypothetical protein